MPDYIKDATANMYLADIKKRDIDNLGLVRKGAKEYVFDRIDHAFIFCQKALTKGLKTLNVDQESILKRFGQQGSRELAIKIIDKAMADNDVKVEKREYPGKDWYRSGWYVYHHNEIAYFVSLPIRVKGGKSRNEHIIVPSRIRYLVVTNVKDVE